MSILFVLLTYIIIITINYMWFREPQAPAVAAGTTVRPTAPVIRQEHGFAVPQGFCFHPGHTWVLREGQDNARVGLDGFAADIVGKIDRIEVTNPNRWVRQGQRLLTLHADGVSFDLVSPVEGVVMAVNQDVIRDPMLAARDPYKDGWIAMLKAPDLAMNERNLMQKTMVAPWMHYNVSRLNAMMPKQNPALAQDGGVPMTGVLLRLEPEVRQKVIREFFLS